MKVSPLLFFVCFSLLFFCWLVLFLRLPSEPARPEPPPLDTSLISQLERHISAEHAAGLRQQAEVSSLLEEKQKKEEEVASLRQQLRLLSSELEARQGGDVSVVVEEQKKVIASLEEKLKKTRKEEEEQELDSKAKGPHLPSSHMLYPSGASSSPSRPGVIILGMHRSGTSVLGGLMNKMGLRTGGPLIGPKEDNAKGFFERIDVVLQNDYLFQKQNVHYSWNTHKYDAKKGLFTILANEDKKFFNEGRRALAFLNTEENFPWMLKDPRLCITLRTWLPLLNFIPAVLFAYRNPYDVALSMHNRETEHFPMQRGLKLWYIYNKRAIQQSHDLCRVITSHKRIISNPKEETEKLFQGLQRCGVPVPHLVKDNDIKTFVDTSLQHGKTKSLDSLCDQEDVDFNKIVPPDSWPTTDASHLHLYRACVQAFCDIEKGIAFKHDYAWDETITNN